MRFVLDRLKLRNFQMMSGHGNGRCSWGVFICIPGAVVGAPVGALRPRGLLSAGEGILYKHIGVGFALLVLHHRAMRRPQAVERVTGTNLHAFFV